MLISALVYVSACVANKILVTRITSVFVNNTQLLSRCADLVRDYKVRQGPGRGRLFSSLLFNIK